MGYHETSWRLDGAMRHWTFGITWLPAFWLHEMSMAPEFLCCGILQSSCWHRDDSRGKSMGWWSPWVDAPGTWVSCARRKAIFRDGYPNPKLDQTSTMEQFSESPLGWLSSGTIISGRLRRLSSSMNRECLWPMAVLKWQRVLNIRCPQFAAAAPFSCSSETMLKYPQCQTQLLKNSLVISIYDHE